MNICFNNYIISQYNPYSGDLRTQTFKRSLAIVERQLGYELRPDDRQLLEEFDEKMRKKMI